jgi:hypothetical protein
LGRGFQEVVQRAVFVAFEVRSADPAQFPDGHHFSDGFEGDREELAVAGVEQQRLVVHDQVRIEREAAGNHV